MSISEKVQGKRTLLYAQNHTDSIVNIFFMVDSQGFRRSADKPLITNLQPESKTLLMTLIALNGVDSSYDYNLIINQNLDNSIDLTADKYVVEDIGPLIQGDVVLFTTEDCEKCEALTSILTQHRVAYRSFDIYQDQKMYDQFLRYLEKTQNVKDSIPLPVIWNKTQWLPSEMPATVLAELLKEK